MQVKHSVVSVALVAASLLLSSCASDADPATATSAPVATATPSPSRTTASPTPTPTPTPSTLSSVDLVCGNLDTDVDYSVHTVPLAEDGSPDYRDLWALKLTCDAGMTGGVVESVPVITPLQKAVAAAAREANYGEDDEGNLYSVYDGCGANDPADYYATSSEYSEAQVLEIRAYLTLCPKHPQAAKWKKGIAATGQAIEAEKNGTRVGNDTYKVPTEMKRGTWVVEDVDDCYWETRDANGEILANNFVLAAPRVVAKVTNAAVVFTSQGCGTWNRQ